MEGSKRTPSDECHALSMTNRVTICKDDGASEKGNKFDKINILINLNILFQYSKKGVGKGGKLRAFRFVRDCQEQQRKVWSAIYPAGWICQDSGRKGKTSEYSRMNFFCALFSFLVGKQFSVHSISVLDKNHK